MALLLAFLSHSCLLASCAAQPHTVYSYIYFQVFSYTFFLPLSLPTFYLFSVFYLQSLFWLVADHLTCCIIMFVLTTVPFNAIQSPDLFTVVRLSCVVTVTVTSELSTF